MLLRRVEGLNVTEQVEKPAPVQKMDVLFIISCFRMTNKEVRVPI